MAISGEEARQEILDDLAAAIDGIALAAGRLGEVYERLSVDSADRLEAELFRPVQRAFGRSKRAHSRFAEQVGKPSHQPAASPPAPPSQPPKELIEAAVVAAAEADHRLAELQDSMLPIEFGDAELRAGLAEAREQLAELPGAAREFLRRLGR